MIYITMCIIIDDDNDKTIIYPTALYICTFCLPQKDQGLFVVHFFHPLSYTNDAMIHK